MKIAIQFFAQLRYWEKQSSVFDLIEAFEECGSTVDVYGTFWEDDYSVEMMEQNKFDYFKDVHLIDMPDDYLIDLWRSKYCLLKSRNYRLKYQIKNNIKYDFVILASPDTIFENINKEEIENFFKQHKKINYIYHLWFTLPVRYSSEACIPYRDDDQAILATEDAANIFSLGFNYIQLSQDSHFIPRYHMDNVSTGKLYNLTTSTLCFDFPIFNIDLINIKHVKESNLDAANRDFADYSTELRLIQRFEDLETFVKGIMNEDGQNE